MQVKLKTLIPFAIVLLAIAGLIAYKNNAVAPRLSDVEPIRATGNVEDAASLLKQGAAVEDEVMAEADSDLELVEEDDEAAAEVLGAADENGF